MISKKITFSFSEGIRLFIVALAIGICIGWVISDIFAVSPLKEEIADHTLYLNANDTIQTKNYSEAERICKMLGGTMTGIACDGSNSNCTIKEASK